MGFRAHERLCSLDLSFERLLRGAWMKLSRRTFLHHLAAGAAALPAMSLFARAQTYPTRPVRILVGFTAGYGPRPLPRRFASTHRSHQWPSAGFFRAPA